MKSHNSTTNNASKQKYYEKENKRFNPSLLINWKRKLENPDSEPTKHLRVDATIERFLMEVKLKLIDNKIFLMQELEPIYLQFFEGTELGPNERKKVQQWILDFLPTCRVVPTFQFGTILYDFSTITALDEVIFVCMSRIHNLQTYVVTLQEQLLAQEQRMPEKLVVDTMLSVLPTNR